MHGEQFCKFAKDSYVSFVSLLSCRNPFLCIGANGCASAAQPPAQFATALLHKKDIKPLHRDALTWATPYPTLIAHLQKAHPSKEGVAKPPV